MWKAWTDPEEVKKWWGPKDFAAPEIKIDLTVGGKYLYCMGVAGLDGVVKDFCISGKFTEIVPMKRIVSTLSFADENGNPVPAKYYGMPGDWPMEVIATVTFEGVEDSKTRLTVQEVGIPGEMILLSPKILPLLLGRLIKYNFQDQTSAPMDHYEYLIYCNEEVRYVIRFLV